MWKPMDMEVGKLKGQRARKPGLYMGNPTHNKDRYTLPASGRGAVDTGPASRKGGVMTPHAASTAIVLRSPSEAEIKRSKKAPKWEDEMERWGWDQGA